MDDKEKLIEFIINSQYPHQSAMSIMRQALSQLYDHRQKELDTVKAVYQQEIDVLKADLALERAMNRSHVLAQETSAPFQLGVAETNRWWASRWIAYYESIRPEITQSFDVIQSMMDEFNAVAKAALSDKDSARVMEK